MIALANQQKKTIELRNAQSLTSRELKIYFEKLSMLTMRIIYYAHNKWQLKRIRSRFCSLYSYTTGELHGISKVEFRFYLLVRRNSWKHLFFDIK